MIFGPHERRRTLVAISRDATASRRTRSGVACRRRSHSRRRGHRKQTRHLRRCGSPSSLLDALFRSRRRLIDSRRRATRMERPGALPEDPPRESISLGRPDARASRAALLNCSVSGCLLETNCRVPVWRDRVDSRHDRRPRAHRRRADREVPADRRRWRYLPRRCTVSVDAATRPAVAAQRAPCRARRNLPRQSIS